MSQDPPSFPKVPDHHPVGKRKKGAFTTVKKLANLIVCTLLCAALLLTPALAMADSARASTMRIDAIQQYNDVCMQVSDLLTNCGLEIVRQANYRIEDIIEESVRKAECAQSEAEVDANLHFFETGAFTPAQEAAIRARHRRLHIEEWCVGCGRCVERCPNGAARVIDGRMVPDHAKCVLCGYCGAACDQYAIKVL